MGFPVFQNGDRQTKFICSHDNSFSQSYLYYSSSNNKKVEMSKELSLDEQDRQVEMWKVKKLIKSLQAARG
jgi:hypothetical protein